MYTCLIRTVEDVWGVYDNEMNGLRDSMNGLFVDHSRAW